MDGSPWKGILVKLGVAVFVVAIVDLIYLNWWILKQDRAQKTVPGPVTIISQSPQPSPSVLPSASPSPLGPSPTPIEKTVLTTNAETVVQTANKEIFIPLGSGSVSTNGFSDIAGSDVQIDLTKYSGIESIVFVASVSVDGGNGRAYARIYNVDDKNPYIESQISSDSSSGSIETSKNIPMPISTKVYRIQAKTDITQFAAHINNPLLKITLK